ncbi:hypothetical protein SLEP1_g51183 [Rubroshorea leprosula]|uniref:Uncharacterized protein n=1 Tax=Rubroshorea leprosula TaxID=152421 RepID=A0AAV5M358_9ROSI|nr:hypothetical protein SLEP1_g51183 [Rubroshorea leprosula]
MASDNQDSHHRKNRRSSSDDEEPEKSSKRHKHRHHRHRHHRHRSKKNGEETIDGVHEIDPPPPASIPVTDDGTRHDDDVEEGEILDEELMRDTKPGESGDQSADSNSVCSVCPCLF